jgi:hypothetical protein
MTTKFELQDGTIICTENNKYYRIGLSISTEFRNIKKNKNSKNKIKTVETYIENFYLLNPEEIKKHIKKYDGCLEFVIEM